MVSVGCNVVFCVYGFVLRFLNTPLVLEGDMVIIDLVQNYI